MGKYQTLLENTHKIRNYGNEQIDIKEIDLDNKLFAYTCLPKTGRKGRRIVYCFFFQCKYFTRKCPQRGKPEQSTEVESKRAENYKAQELFGPILLHFHK